MNISEKICKIMGWEPVNGESYEDILKIRNIKSDNIPEESIVDVVYYGGLDMWARKSNATSQHELTAEIMDIMKKTVNSTTLSSKATAGKFPLIQNFYIYCNNASRRDALYKEADKISENAWFSEIARKRLDERTAKMFSSRPDKKKFKAAANRIKKIWGFNNIEIDAFRYFVCQTRHSAHNPSMNKSLYLYGSEKKTGKTTVAKTVISILNGAENINNSGEFESSLIKEMQYNEHEVPKAVTCNAVFLDEAMPKDSRRMYGQVKQMLTSNSCNFNQKYGSIVTLPAKRYYIFTSNEDLSEFIQDENERRFIPISMNRQPQQISFEEIFKIWKDFCTNAVPEPDWQQWYNSFQYVDGLMTKDKDYFVLAIESDPHLPGIISNINKYYLSPPFFHDHLLKGKATREEKKAINAAMHQLFGEPYAPSKWKRTEIYSILTDESDTYFNDDDSPADNNNSNIDKLPF